MEGGMERNGTGIWGWNGENNASKEKMEDRQERGQE
jgi:hypothetical protein